ncbi:transcriptional regulator [Mucilaginibacter sp. MD40]|uniref:Crp/Fnr family transcriptional regulator n=1 Tax=Mucilaginibacter sp. MD40 TaxID=2029590 RepID=UPI000BACA2AE|nr:Crp/Fnr family transcriptional regulator [Mucilaginibacter sp. MD40]PAW93596.1 transcriptional regulator [Mucilaginibacter sp. MD40]
MKESRVGCNLKSCYLCTHCVNEWIPAIAANKKNFSVKKNQRIFSEGDAVAGMYFVYSGKVKVHKRWDDDKEIILRFASAGDILGHMGLGDEPVYPVSATAIEPVTVCFIDLQFFESSLKVNPQLTYSLMKFFANQLQDSEKRMRNLVHMQVKERIALAILTLKKQFGTTSAGAIDIELTRQDLSSFAAVSYETLFKVTNEFIQNKLISVTGKSIAVLNEQLLNKVAMEHLV